MIKSIKQLTRDRINLVEAHKKNNFTDGIKALLTDLYPDTAHFIYELLQNAEDMNATIVRFALHKDKIEFEHNGTKRDFNLDDIDAITNIGHNSQKKNDPTSIGKFGVGFKAVFAYTSTPEIHSGKYHFRIKEYFIPEFDGVKKIDVYDTKKIKWTKFIFPFDNPKKPKDVAVKEISNSLKELNDSSILFLNNIKRIEYTLVSGSFSYIERDEKKLPFITIKYKPIVGNEKTSEWLKYSENISIVDDQGNDKQLNIAVAYSLEKNNSQDYRIVPIDGKVFIYFPAEKEYSGLKFHINAPFASTVARDSVRNCADNMKLIKNVAKLMANSIDSIKGLGLLNIDLLEILPHDNETPPFYNVFFDYLYSKFNKEPLLPTKYNNDYATIKEGLSSNAIISNLISEDDLSKLGILNKKWIVNAMRNSRADKFMNDLNIDELTYVKFKDLIISKNTMVEKLLESKDNSWLRKFYRLCEETIKNIPRESLYSPSKEKEKFIQTLKETKIIRSTGANLNKMYRCDDIYILPTNTKLNSKNALIPIVSKDLYYEKAKENKDIYDFLHLTLGIEEYGQKVEIERLIDKYNDKEIEIDDEYFETILKFAKYNAENLYEKINFNDKSVFIGKNKEELYVTNLRKIVLSNIYGNECGGILLDINPDLYELWDGYYNKYNKEELEIFLKFVKESGIVKTLAIEESRIRNNPQYYEKLYSNAKSTKYSNEKDYTINDIEEILKDITLDVAKLVWETLKENNRIEYATAYNCPNKSGPSKRCESTLFYYLKNKAWLPDKKGNFYKPGNIAIKDLHEKFEFDESKILLKYLEIGNNLDFEKKVRAKLEKEGKKYGLVVITDEEAAEFEEFKKYKSKKIKSNENFNLDSEINKLNKNKNSKEYNNIPDDSIGNVKNREKKIEETFKDAQKMSALERKISSSMATSNIKEKEQLKQWYAGSCQICDTTIIGHDGDRHFEAINIFSSSQLPSKLVNTFSVGWNSLCLCPNCALKYKVASKKMNSFFKQIEENEVYDGDYGFIYLDIELNEEEQAISYVPKHFIALKKGISLLKKHSKTNEIE